MPDTRRMTLGELLDRTFRLVLRRLPLFAGILIPLALIQISVELVASGLGPATAQLQDLLSDSHALLEQVPVLAAVIVVQAISSWLVMVIALAVLSRAVADLEQGGASIVRSYRDVGGQATTLAALTLIFLLMAGVAIAGTTIPMALASLIHPALGVLVGLAAFTIFLGGYLAAMAWLCLAVPAASLERISAPAALRRSVELVRGRFGRVLGLIVLTGIAAGAVTLIVQGPFVLLQFLLGSGGATYWWARALVTLSGGAAMVLSSPLLLAAVAVAYMDAANPAPDGPAGAP